jgi:hypothetical protein
VFENHGLRQQLQYPGVKLQPAEAEVLDAGLLVGFLQAFGKHAAHGETDLGTGQKHFVESRLLQDGTGSGPHGHDACRTRPACEQGHFSEAGARLQLTQQEVDSGVGVLLADFHGARGNEKHRIARTALLHDGLLRGELARAQVTFEQQALLIGEVSEEADLLEVMASLGRRRCRIHCRRSCRGCPRAGRGRGGVRGRGTSGAGGRPQGFQGHGPAALLALHLVRQVGQPGILQFHR